MEKPKTAHYRLPISADYNDLTIVLISIATETDVENWKVRHIV